MFAALDVHLTPVPYISLYSYRITNFFFFFDVLNPEASKQPPCVRRHPRVPHAVLSEGSAAISERGPFQREARSSATPRTFNPSAFTTTSEIQVRTELMLFNVTSVLSLCTKRDRFHALTSVYEVTSRGGPNAALQRLRAPSVSRNEGYSSLTLWRWTDLRLRLESKGRKDYKRKTRKTSCAWRRDELQPRFFLQTVSTGSLPE